MLRDDPTLAGTPVLLLTSIVHYISQEELGRAGIVRGLLKPVRSSVLAECISQVLGANGLRPNADRSALPAPALPSLQSEGALPTPARALLVEDNAVNRKVGTKMLEHLGWRADVACNGREAVEAVQNTEYAVVLMDCHMPDMDGFEATRAIRDLGGRFRVLPIVALTASAMLGDRERCLEAGMDDYISKPVSREDMERVLRPLRTRDCAHRD
jgi:CheY-like chemotaxis protein